MLLFLVPRILFIICILIHIIILFLIFSHSIPSLIRSLVFPFITSVHLHHLTLNCFAYYSVSWHMHLWMICSPDYSNVSLAHFRPFVTSFNFICFAFSFFICYISHFLRICFLICYTISSVSKCDYFIQLFTCSAKYAFPSYVL